MNLTQRIEFQTTLFNRENGYQMGLKRSLELN